MKNLYTPLLLAAMAGTLPLQALAQDDVTSQYITNPSFENGLTGWSSSNLKSQTNSSFAPKEGNTYLEQWVSAGNKVSNAYVKQTLKGLPAGTYKLTAAAQNTQNGSAAKGAVLTAGGKTTTVGEAGDYSVDFTVIDGEAEIGFEVTSCTGNWVACDNFRLTLIGQDLEALHAELQSRIDEAQKVLNANPSGSKAAELQNAISNAQSELAATTADNLSAVAKALTNAVLEFRVANSKGTVPTVVTEKRFTRGVTHIYARSQVSGVATSKILEQGYCWSTENNPSIYDNRSTDYLESNGTVYKMSGLSEATVYYIRAYAITTDYAVGYGDVLKVITLPRGGITYTYEGNAPTEEVNTRIEAAVKSAVEAWNEQTSIQGFSTSVHYGADTPTADCSYGGWMRIGPNEGNQKTGTVMHEMAHGIGVGTHTIWTATNSPMRAGQGTGNWLGERANEVVKFWKNDDTAVLTGDGTHMWPYGVNGAHEDDGSEVLYTANGQIVQALGEDGLPPAGGFGTPTYSFEHTDGVKYYLKNEDEDYGLLTSFLTTSEDGTLSWTELSTGEVAQHDEAAWTVTFNPATCYYQLRNVGTGRYLTYDEAKSLKYCTAEATAPADAQNFHLMRGRVDVTIGNAPEVFRGYWIVHPEKTLNPHTMGTMSKGRVLATTFDLKNTATAQRWLILTADDVNALEENIVAENKQQLQTLLTAVKQLPAVPHKEQSAGADAALAEAVSVAEALLADAKSTSNALADGVDNLRASAVTFLAAVTPVDAKQPFDVTFLLNSADLSDLSAWKGTPEETKDGCASFSSTFNFYQTATKLPAGTYAFTAQGFQRVGEAKTAYTNYVNGEAGITATIYAGTKSNKLMAQGAGAQSEKKASKDTRVSTTPSLYVPSDLSSAVKYFEDSVYTNKVVAKVSTTGGSLMVGLRNNTDVTSGWCAFGCFGLKFYGTLSEDDATTGIHQAQSAVENAPMDVYTLSGVRVRSQVNTLQGLQPGLYIVNGKKTLVK